MSCPKKVALRVILAKRQSIGASNLSYIYADPNTLMSISSRSMTSKPYVENAGAGESEGELHDKCLFLTFLVEFIIILQ